MIIKKDPKKIIDFAYNFKNLVNAKNWIPQYDVDTDSLAIIPSRLSKDARIRYIDNELAFYIRANGDIEGIFIEYFKNNFIKHHKDAKFKKFNKVISKKEQKNKDNKSLLELSKTSLKQVLPELEKVVQGAVVQK
tara:strand:+ start:1279 stop:1683 length:405 start_codon:yes stop_codon:yes gene_type:complete